MVTDRIKIFSNQYFFNKNISVYIDNKFDLSKVNDINSFSEKELIKAINPIIDNELIKITPSNLTQRNIIFNINNSNDYLTLFTRNEINTRNPKFINSFWIFEYYNTFDKTTQKLLYRQFHNPHITSNSNIELIYFKNNKTNQLEYENLYIPKSSISELNGVIYLKYRFFNAKTGEIYNFKQNFINNIEKSNFLEINFDKTELKWYIANANTNFVNYTNPFMDIPNNMNNNVSINNNRDKGSFINNSGNYQDGSIVSNNTLC